MSFARLGRSQQPTKGKESVRAKKAKAPKRDWVSTVHDLSVHKPTPAELTHRHEIHKSRNKAVAQWELKEKALKRCARQAGSPAPLDPASLSIIREVFSDQLLLQDVLARSDRAMAVVKDLFGDAPQRQIGHPSVTMAPNCDSDTELPVLERPDPPTHLSFLSQSMMDQEALNDLEVSKENRRVENTSSDSHVIHRVTGRKSKSQSGSGVLRQQKMHHSNFHHADSDDGPVTPCASRKPPNQNALNATVAVQRVRSKHFEENEEETSSQVSQVLNPEPLLCRSGRSGSCTRKVRKCVSHGSELDGSTAASLSGEQSGLGLLQAMLGQVEADLDAFCPQMASAQSLKQHKTQSLTGFSVALVSTLGRLVHLLRQAGEDTQKETEGRRRLEGELKEQRGLIDALTAETMALREEAAAVQADLQRRTAELEQKLDNVVLAMGGLGLLGEPSSPYQTFVPGKCAPDAERAPTQTQGFVSPAVLLTPPRQESILQQSPGLHPQQLPSIDFLRSREPDPPPGSASGLTGLSSGPSLSVTSDSRHSHFSPDSLLDEITKLKRENDLIRAQLSQAQGLGSGVRGASGRSDDRKSSTVTGRVSPQNEGERITSKSASTNRRRQEDVCPGKELQLEQTRAEMGSGVVSETPTKDTLSVNSVEQRLLELNRKSAAARERLLELIEQQKQSVAGRAFNSDSPIPASAFSPAAGAELVPERELPSHHRGERRSVGSVGSDVSSHRLGFEIDRNSQVDKQKKSEGWFALSAHMR
ncbi:spindle and centriole-associated protein 1 isoform X2 [Oryzias latipes]|uniref:spindle and centriole-associated protein 1 isoform X2 n=1 Tax=Oryzias latipes TaxID=8090 RepID=UPI0005CBA351|nr:spindle and centriole-associated protein 1 isoform X2 [Oryzias latipes]